MTVPGRSLRLRPTTIWLSCGVCVDARNDRLGRDEGPGGGGDDGRLGRGNLPCLVSSVLGGSGGRSVGRRGVIKDNGEE